MLRPARRTLVASLAAVLPLFLAVDACGPDDGFVDSDWSAERKLGYLEYATEGALNPASVLQVFNHMERERVDPTFSTGAPIPADSWDHIFEKLRTFRDTSDFDMLRFLYLLHAFRGHPLVPEELWQKTEAAVLSFKYWYTDETPPRLVDGELVIDDMFYWTENHALLFYTCDYLAGQLFPDAVFEVSGLTGEQQMLRARSRILQWLELRARFGFQEWHSDVYYQKDIDPLVALIEYARHPVIAQKAKMVLDLVFLDVALHLHRGNFGATHGRSYVKDKGSGTKADNFNSSKLFFDDTTFGYTSRSAFDASLLAHARRYRLPEVIRRIAADDVPMVDRERMNLPIQDHPPLDNAEPPGPAPFGLDWQDERNLPYWWASGAWSNWQVLRLTFEVAERENLWVTEAFAPFQVLIDLVWVPGDLDLTMFQARGWLQFLWSRVSLALLEEVNTYTYRTGEYMLSTAQDYRKGVRGSETHSWQATFDENAIVYTQHPAYLPPEGDIVNWQQTDEPGPGYWTGESSQPRSAQHMNVGIHLYAPQYEGWFGDVFADFAFRDETHAYFPHAHFDEVDQAGHWTFGRRGDAYVALYSHRETEWRDGYPDVHENAGQPFDLVAAGAPENVWIVECGDANQWGTYEAFKNAFDDDLVDVTPLGVHAIHVISGGFDVVYESPSQGRMTFGWQAPLTVGGAPVPIADYPRMDNPFAQVPFADRRYEVTHGDWNLLLDFADGTREASGPDQ